MARVTSVLRSPRPAIAVSAGWPLARRLGLSAVRPGGLAMTRRLLAGAGVGTGDRVVDLTPGDGACGRLAGAANLHAWTGVCLDKAQARRVGGAVRGHGRGTVLGAPDRTELEDGTASVVLAEGLLSGLSGPGKHAVLEEAARILRPEGRLGLHELCVLEGPWGSAPAAEIAAQMAPYSQGGLRVLTEAGWRQAVEDAGLVMVGASLGPLEIPGMAGLLKLQGPRAALSVVARMLRPGGPGPRVRRAVEQLTRHQDRLAAIVIIAERPVVGALRRHGG